jgi:hypothetical protein
MATSTTPAGQITADEATQERILALVSDHSVWTGDLPEVITGPRALHLAVTVGYGSLQRMGHKRVMKDGKVVPVSPTSVAKVMAARGFTVQEVEDLQFLASQRNSAAAQATAKACAAFLKAAAKAQEA